MIRYGQVKGRKYPACQPIVFTTQDAGRIDHRINPSIPTTIIIDGCVRCRTVAEAADFAGVRPWEVKRVLSGERKSVKGHTFHTSCIGGVV